MRLYVEQPPGEVSGLPPLVLIHGWGMHGGVWQPVVKKLSQYFSIYVVDLPGMGYSPPLDAPDIDDFADAVAAVLPPHADVCGWSLGGMVAMRIAMRHPEKVRRLVVVGTTPKFVNARDWQDGMDATIFRQFAADISSDYQATLLRFLTLQCMRAEDARHTVKQLREVFETRPVPTQSALQHGLDILLNTDLRPQLDQLHKPVLLLHGDRDSLAPLPAAQWLASHLPFGRLRVIAGASHAPFLSHQALFVEGLLQFLEPVQVPA